LSSSSFLAFLDLLSFLATLSDLETFFGKNLAKKSAYYIPIFFAFFRLEDSNNDSNLLPDEKDSITVHDLTASENSSLN